MPIGAGRTRSAHAQPAFHQIRRFSDRDRVPARAVLVGQQNQRPVRCEARLDPGHVESHQCQQAERLGLVGHQTDEQRGQPLRIPCQVAAIGDRPVRGEISLVEDEVEDGEDRFQPPWQLARLRDAVRDPGVADLALRSNQPLSDRCLGDEEGAGDLRRVEATDRAEGERDLRLPRQRWVAAGEEEAQPIVGGKRPAGRDRALHLVCLLSELHQPLAEPRIPAQPVDCTAARRRHQPGPRIARQALGRPVLERGHRRLLHKLLGKVPVTEDADQRGDQAGALLRAPGPGRCPPRDVQSRKLLSGQHTTLGQLADRAREPLGWAARR